tara:strand:- start:28175 stop:28375 length:201 start_codon:yes stop_codon:yes gene_type:complete
MNKFHTNPQHFIQVIENALNQCYFVDEKKWKRVHSFYESRYLNPDSPEQDNLKHGIDMTTRRKPQC